MTFSETIFAPAKRPLDIAVLVLPRASILEVASVLDPLRNANRHLGNDGSRWRVVSPAGDDVPLTSGIALPSVGPLTAAVGADALIIIAGYNQSEVATRPLIAGLRRVAGRFRAALGTGPGAVYLDLRLQMARRMVADTDHDLRNIALRCGFFDPTSFSRAFRRRFGMAPSRIRMR